jgi:hypothetical protein
MGKIIFALLCIAILAGGIALAAQGSAPGDALYPFKTQITEPIESMLSYSDTIKASFSAGIAEQRLAEMKNLLDKGSLDSQTEVQLTATFDAYAQQVSDQIQILEKNGDYTDASRIASDFQQTLADRVTQFSNTNTQGEAAMQTLLTPLINHIQTALDSMSALNADIGIKTGR